MLVVGEVSITLSTLLKMGQEKLYPPTDISVSLAAVSTTPTFGQV